MGSQSFSISLAYTGYLNTDHYVIFVNGVCLFVCLFVFWCFFFCFLFLFLFFFFNFLSYKLRLQPRTRGICLWWRCERSKQQLVFDGKLIFDSRFGDGTVVVFQSNKAEICQIYARVDDRYQIECKLQHLNFITRKPGRNSNNTATSFRP